MDITVLLVEDDDADAMLVSRAIRKTLFNARLVRVKDGDEAVEYLQGRATYVDRAEHPLPAVVLLDIKMPRRDGFELLAWIRKQPAPLSRTAVVMFTSSGRAVDVNRAYELGANSYLRKPDLHADLVTTLTVFNDYWLMSAALPEIAVAAEEADA